ncbi:hypothetical protein [Plantactinospora sonchi]|uniref:ESX-1 secretion-associated protein n=1 Tax=Plantactinospora sonchi TaxID=1544735 RepID=A0ABU7RM36_9ACTN
MSGQDIRMPVEAVARHATSVDAAADAMMTAHAAASQVHSDQESYGKLIAGLLPALLNMISASGVKALDASVSTLRDTADALRTAATSSESTDRASATRSMSIAPKRDLPL